MKLVYIQPLLASYRNQLLISLCDPYDVIVLAEKSSATSSGFGLLVNSSSQFVDTPIRSFFNGRLFFQKNIISTLFRQWPGVVVTFANSRFITYWLSLVFCKIVGIRFYSHGQGIYAYPDSGMLRKVLYRSMVALSTRYICYNELSYQSLIAIGCKPSKLANADNSVLLSECVMPNERTYKEDGVLFVGRLREGCRLELLVGVIRELKNKYPGLTLHIIGSGALADDYLKNFAQDDWIVWHGAIYDDEKISEISRSCRIGCYPGDAGLSVVHMFGLSLPPLVHRSISEHMGPEPSYVSDGGNGFLFDKDNSGLGLAAGLERALSLNPLALRAIGERAYQYYVSLNSPPLGERFLHILAEDEKNDSSNNMRQGK